jgi:integrase
MSKVKKKPEYQLHKGTGQARVWINGKDHYLGPYNSPASYARYEELISEWFAKSGNAGSADLLVEDLALRYQAFADRHYRKDGEPTSEAYNIRLALRYVVEAYGEGMARDFGPRALKTVRQKMIEAGCVRTSINRMIGRIRRMFRWAVAEELVPASIHQGLAALTGLSAGRSDAVESAPVKPVPRAYVDAIRPYVSRQVWGAIQLQLLCGARAGEILSMRGCDLNMTGNVWEYIPQSHKMEHKGRERIIFIGPRAQSIVREFLKPDLTAYLFSPADAWEEHLAERRAGRQTPMTPSQRVRGRKAKRTKQPGDRYTVCSYGQAIRTACRKADRQAHKVHPEIPADQTIIPTWHSHQLRHAAGTTVRREFGLEASRVMLGHASAVVSEWYSERDAGKAREVAMQVG